VRWITNILCASVEREAEPAKLRIKSISLKLKGISNPTDVELVLQVSPSDKWKWSYQLFLDLNGAVSLRCAI